MSNTSSDTLAVFETVSEGVIQNSVFGSSGDYMAAIRARFEFVYYLEAREGEGRAVAGTVEAFLATPEKSKWEN